MKIWQNVSIYTSLFASSACVHLSAFLLHGPHPLGYDTGFYRRYFIEPLVTMPNLAVPGLSDFAFFPRLFLDLLRHLPFSIDALLYAGFIFLMALTPITLFAVLKKDLGTFAAYTAALFFILSSVTFTAYWFMLLKQALALPVLIITIFALSRKKFLIAGYGVFVLALTHVTTLLFFCIFFAAYIPHLLNISQKLRLGYYALALGVLSIFAIFPDLFLLILPLVPEGFFISWFEFILLSFPFTIPILILWRYVPKITLPVEWIIFGAVSLLYPLLHLPFFERIFIFTNVSLIIASAIATAILVQKIREKTSVRKKFLYTGSLVVMVFFIAGNLYTTIIERKPIFNSENIIHFEEIDALVPRGAIILTTAYEAPWYIGWTYDHIAAPGMLKDIHSEETWRNVWENPSKEKTERLLSAFPQPLYISSFNPIEELIGVLTPCIHPLSSHVYIFTCPQTTN